MDIVLDIETSGLSPSPKAEDDFVTCIGILTERGIIQITEPAFLFRADPFEAEKRILTRLSEVLYNIGLPDNTLLTYNGIAFDIPFLQERLQSHHLVASTPHLPLIHHDLAHFAFKALGRRVSKDEACSKLANMYVPKKTAGLYTARIYKQRIVTEEQHLEMLQHNAIDLAVTARLWNAYLDFPDSREFYFPSKKSPPAEDAVPAVQS